MNSNERWLLGELKKIVAEHDVAQDEWDESKHKRADNGQFGSGGGGGNPRKVAHASEKNRSETGNPYWSKKDVTDFYEKAFKPGTKYYVTSGPEKGSAITIKKHDGNGAVTIGTEKGDVDIPEGASMAINTGMWSRNPNGKPVNYPDDSK